MEVGEYSNIIPVKRLVIMPMRFIPDWE
jgi:hypothetical protein